MATWRPRRGGRLAVLAALAATAVAGSACSLLVDTDGFSGGATDAGADGARDAGGDVAIIPDAGSPSDAATDARFCELHADAALCLDFDDALPVSSYFSGTNFDPRVTTAIGAGAFPTPSLSFDFPGGTLASGALQHEAHRQLVVTVQKIARFSARLLVDRTDGPHNVRALEIALSKNGGFITFFVHAQAAQSNLFSQIYGTDGGYQSTIQTDLSRAIPIGVPVRVEILVDASQNPGKATVLLDGQIASPALDFDPQLVIGSSPEASVHLTVYTNAGVSIAATTFHFDDLLLETE
jgi:hypothetical protein